MGDIKKSIIKQLMVIPKDDWSVLKSLRMVGSQRYKEEDQSDIVLGTQPFSSFQKAGSFPDKFCIYLASLMTRFGYGGITLKACIGQE